MNRPFAQWPATEGQLKAVSFLNRKKGMSTEAFSEHWRTIHKEHALTLIGAGLIQGYVQNHPVKCALEALPLFDGSPEIWIKHPNDLNVLAASPEYLEGAAVDEPNFVEMPVLSCVMQVNATHIDTKRLNDTPIKLMLSVKPPHGMAFAEFRALWLGLEKDCCFTQEPAQAWVRQLAVAEFAEHSPFWAVESSWWPSCAALMQAWQARALPSWLKTSQLQGLISHEMWVKSFS